MQSLALKLFAFMDQLHDFLLLSLNSFLHPLGATKKMCVRKIKRENGAKSYFRTCQAYFKSKLAENLEVIILRKLTKINIQKFCINLKTQPKLPYQTPPN